MDVFIWPITIWCGDEYKNDMFYYFSFPQFKCCNKVNPFICIETSNFPEAIFFLLHMKLPLCRYMYIKICINYLKKVCNILFQWRNAAKERLSFLKVYISIRSNWTKKLRFYVNFQSRFSEMSKTNELVWEKKWCKLRTHTYRRVPGRTSLTQCDVLPGTHRFARLMRFSLDTYFNSSPIHHFLFDLFIEIL